MALLELIETRRRGKLLNMDSGSIVKCNLNNDYLNNKLKRIVTESPVLFLSAI